MHTHVYVYVYMNMYVHGCLYSSTPFITLRTLLTLMMSVSVAFVSKILASSFTAKVQNSQVISLLGGAATAAESRYIVFMVMFSENKKKDGTSFLLENQRLSSITCNSKLK